MTLADVISQTRTLLQDNEYEEDIITMAANWFVYELLNNNRTRLMETSTVIEAASGDTTLDFPDDLMAWINIYLTSPQIYDMNNYMHEYGEFMGKYSNFATATAGQARDWTQFGNGMRFAQPMSADSTFNIDYIREPVPMESDSDDCEIPDRYAELVARGTKIRILEIDEEYAEAAQERNILAPLMTTFIRNESRGGGKTKPTVIRTNRFTSGRKQYIGE